MVSNEITKLHKPRECEYCAYGLCAIHLNTLGDADDCYLTPEHCPDFIPKTKEKDESN